MSTSSSGIQGSGMPPKIRIATISTPSSRDQVKPVDRVIENGSCIRGK